MSRSQTQPNTILDEQLAHLRERVESVTVRIDLTETEVERLSEILDRGFSPTPALRPALSRLADPKRQPPRLDWKETAA